MHKMEYKTLGVGTSAPNTIVMSRKSANERLGKYLVQFYGIESTDVLQITYGNQLPLPHVAAEKDDTSRRGYDEPCQHLHSSASRNHPWI